MEHYLTKFCYAKRVTALDENGVPVRVYCEQCEGQDPLMEWVELPKVIRGERE